MLTAIVPVFWCSYTAVVPVNFESSCLTFAEKAANFYSHCPFTTCFYIITLHSSLFGNSLSVKMASGDDSVRPKNAAATRSTTGKAKVVDYKQLVMGNYEDARWRGDEFDSGRSDQDLIPDFIRIDNRKLVRLGITGNPFPFRMVV